MKKILSTSLLVSLVACGGGCGGGGGGAASSSLDGAPPSATATKPIVNYASNFIALGEGSYNVLCGDKNKSQIPAVVQLSKDGLLTPWFDGALNTANPIMFFDRTLRGAPKNDIFAILGSTVSWGISSDGLITALDGPDSKRMESPLGAGSLSGFVSALYCDGAAEAKLLAEKSAYKAFDKYIDVPKMNLRCVKASTPLGPDSNGFIESYEISNGELIFQGRKISLLSGFSKESVGVIGSETVKSATGGIIYKQSLTYALEKTDGSKLGITVNEFGDFVGFTYQAIASPQLTCFRSV